SSVSITRWDDRFVSSRPLILGLSKDERSRGPQRSALADSIFQSGPVLRSVKLQVRGSTRGSRLPTFGTYRADPWQVANAASPRSCTSDAATTGGGCGAALDSGSAIGGAGLGCGGGIRTRGGGSVGASMTGGV